MSADKSEGRIRDRSPYWALAWPSRSPMRPASEYTHLFNSSAYRIERENSDTQPNAASRSRCLVTRPSTASATANANCGAAQ